MLHAAQTYSLEHIQRYGGECIIHEACQKLSINGLRCAICYACDCVNLQPAVTKRTILTSPAHTSFRCIFQATHGIFWADQRELVAPGAQLLHLVHVGVEVLAQKALKVFLVLPARPGILELTKDHISAQEALEVCFVSPACECMSRSTVLALLTSCI